MPTISPPVRGPYWTQADRSAVRSFTYTVCLEPVQGRVARAFDALVRSRWPLVIVVAIGILARCRQYFGAPSYWHDEAYLLLNVVEKSFAELLGPLRLNQASPPLFLWLLRVLYNAAGSSEWAMRLPAFAASLAGLLLMIPLAQHCVGARSWQWAVAFCALSSHSVMHAYEVKPYAGDCFASLVVLLLTIQVLRHEVRRYWLLGLVAAAAILPWTAYPSVFVLGGTSITLFVNACRQRSGRVWLQWIGLNLVLGFSCGLLWWTVARHQRNEYLVGYWDRYFLDFTSPAQAITTVWRDLVGMAKYGTTGMAIPLLILAAIGVAALTRRTAECAILLISPLILAGIASATHRYPLNDRLGLFAVPMIWLAAAAGIGEVARWLQERRCGPVMLLFIVLLLPDLARTVRDALVVKPICAFRDAFEFVHQHQSPEDKIWVLHTEVYEAYYGKVPSLMGWYTPPDQVEQAANVGPIWMVFPPCGANPSESPEVRRYLRSASCRPVLQHHVKGLEIVRYEPIATGGPTQ